MWTDYVKPGDEPNAFTGPVNKRICTQGPDGCCTTYKKGWDKCEGCCMYNKQNRRTNEKISSTRY